MRNTTEIMEYLKVGQNRQSWEAKTLDKALEIEKRYQKEISDGTVGYALICDFDCSPFILEDEDKTEMIEKERFKEAGLVVYEIKNKGDIIMNTLNQKIDKEIQNFKKTYETMTATQVYNDWYIIGFYESYYDFLVYLIEDEQSYYSSKDILKWLNTFENPIGFLYSEWLSCDDAGSLSWDDMFVWLKGLMNEILI